MIHEDKFDELMNAHMCTLGISSWLTGDLVNLSLLIDAELQQRADEEGCVDEEDYEDYLEEQLGGS